MTVMILDRERDAPLLKGYRLITTEVEFLTYAVEGVPLHIQGDGLCNWAEQFFRGRRIEYREATSIIKELEHNFPGLSENQIQRLISRLGDEIHLLPKPITAQKLLDAIYPGPLWAAQPSTSHLAEWLMWVYENQPTDEIQVLLGLLGSRWADEYDREEAHIYPKVFTSIEAESALEKWLGIANREDFLPTKEFPLEIPDVLLERARDKWNASIVLSQGKFFEQFELLTVPFQLKKLAAKETYLYFIQNVSELQPQQISILARYLSYKEVNELRKRLTPVLPSELPDYPEAIIKWFESEYLPYREWHDYYSSKNPPEKVLQLARQFGLWYLDNYPKALSGGGLSKWVSFYRTGHLDQNPDVLTLIMVLDGLHATDARTLMQNIRSHTSRLSIITEDLVFSPIPTITQFAKEALFRGVPPDKASTIDTVGSVLPEDKSPAQRLANQNARGVYLWRVLEPDRTYHQKNKSENLQQDIAGRLEAEALKIKEIIETIPDDKLLQIIITTDHGRLLGNSIKTLDVPDGMESHGRTAFGESGLQYPAEGYIVKENIAYLYGERFGMPTDVAISLGEAAFLGNDNRTGSEVYPHGGLFPEEVIVPWIVFARDVIQPKVEITISGEGRARGSGKLQIKVLNLSDIDLKLETITLYYRNGSEKTLIIGKSLDPRKDTITEVEMELWPSAAEASGVNSIAKVRQPNGIVFDYSVAIDIQSKDLYERDETLFEDLFS